MRVELPHQQLPLGCASNDQIAGRGRIQQLHSMILCMSSSTAGQSQSCKDTDPLYPYAPLVLAANNTLHDTVTHPTCIKPACCRLSNWEKGIQAKRVVPYSPGSLAFANGL
jgi:hypothetical protein